MEQKFRVPRSKGTVICLDKNGGKKWEDSFANAVTDQGITDLITQYFKGNGYNAVWYIGLIDGTPTFDNADTMAAHAGWTENISYAAGVRPTLTLGAVGSKTVSNNETRSTVTMTAAGTVAGVFLSTSNVKGSTTGVLYSEATFLTGSKIVEIDDMLFIAVTLTGEQ